MATYEVTEYPGFPGPTGFIRPGGRVTLPDDATPSRTFIPLDEAAHAALVKAKAAYVADLERRRARRKLAPLDDFEKGELLKVPEIPKAIPSPEKRNAQPEEIDPEGKRAEEEGQTIREVAFERGHLDANAPAAAARAGKRAADSK